MRRILFAITGIAAVLGLLAVQGANATITPTNVSVKAAVLEAAAPGQHVKLLDIDVRTSAPADLLLQATAECSILTTMAVPGTDSQRSQGVIDAWIEVDGQPVPMAETDDGRVTLCDRAYQRTPVNGDLATNYQRTKAANAFDWVAVGVAAGTHSVELWATLTTTATNNATATGVVGNRTLVVGPTRAWDGTVFDL